MQVNLLDHINVVTEDIDRTAGFYTAVLGLERRDAPSPLPPGEVQWMFDGNGRALVHISHADRHRAMGRVVAPGEKTGAIHHVAFGCSGFEDLIERLTSLGLDHHINRLESIGLRQVFVTDPNNVVLELNFYED